MKDLISIIVPVFNVEPYLSRCIDSILCQTYSNLEIILVDDGSVDSSETICDDYASKDSRIKVIHKNNGGLSSARNAGLDIATGDYLMFVDSDDYISPEFCEIPYGTVISYGADLVMFDYYEINRQKTKKTKSFPEGFKDPETAINMMFGDLGQFSWNKLYKRELFDDLRFPEGFLYEDHAVTYKAALHAKKIYYIPQALYYYCRRADSITRIVSYKANCDVLALDMAQAEDLIANGFDKPTMLSRMVNYSMRFLINSHHSESDPSFIKASQCIKINPFFSNLDAMSKRRKIMYFIYRISPHLFNFICSSLGKKAQ